MPGRLPVHRTGPALGPDARAVQRAYNRRRPESDALYGTARWKRLRAAKLRAEPLCEACRARGRVVLASTAHHKRVVSEHGTAAFFDLEGLESVCRACHAAIHGGDPAPPGRAPGPPRGG